MARIIHIARCVWLEAFTDRTFMVAAGLAFFALFSLLPALAVVGLVLTWMVDGEAVGEELDDADALLPEGTPELFAEFLLAAPGSLAAGLGLSVNLLVVFWTVQRAASGLITALNVVYDEDEERDRLRRELVAVAIALGGLFFLFLALFVALVLPMLADRGGAMAGVASAFRWPLLAAMFMGALCLLYAHAPSRGERTWTYILLGAAVATVLWLVATLLFALYMEHVGGWDVYYGSVTAAVVLMTWMFISSFLVMLGAEVDAQIGAEARPEKKGGTKDTLDRREQAGGRGAG